MLNPFGLTGWAAVFVISLEIIAGWLVADLITAFVHLTLDKLYGTRIQSWPLVGRMILEFKEHHDFPGLMVQRGFWESSRETVLPSLLAVVFACLGLPWFWLTVGVGTALCQEVHKLAHRQVVPGWVGGLQTCGLFITSQVHGVHHNGVFTRNFGILNGWSNPLMNGMLWLLGY